MISKEQVKHTAQLARLDLTDSELEKMREEISSILELIDELKKANTEKVTLMSHPNESRNVTRQDQELKLSSENIKQLLEEMPQKQGKLTKVKAIFNKTA